MDQFEPALLDQFLSGFDRIAFAIKYEKRRREHHRRDIRDINRDDGSGVRLPFSGRIRVTK
jgi:molybdate-binding protein